MLLVEGNDGLTEVPVRKQSKTSLRVVSIGTLPATGFGRGRPVLLWLSPFSLAPLNPNIKEQLWGRGSESSRRICSGIRLLPLIGNGCLLWRLLCREGDGDVLLLVSRVIDRTRGYIKAVVVLQDPYLQRVGSHQLLLGFLGSDSNTMTDWPNWTDVVGKCSTLRIALLPRRYVLVRVVKA